LRSWRAAALKELGALAKESNHEHEKESTADGGETTAESLQPPVPVAQKKMRQEIIVTKRLRDSAESSPIGQRHGRRGSVS
jgi:hypothetical protein